MARIRAALSRDAVALAVIVGAAALFSALWTLRVREWGFMTDEMLYVKLALHFGDTGSPVPHVRGEYLPEFKLLYPTLIAPVFALLSMPAAFVVAHALNSLLVAAAAIPGYLLGREIGLSRAGRLLVAGIVTILPWTVMSMFLMTESLAYPLFLLAAWGIVRAVARPTPRSEALAIGLIALATATRAQFLGLVPIFAVTAFLYDAGRARRTGGSVWLELRERRVLWGSIVGILAIGFVLSAVGADGGIAWGAARLRASGVVVADVLSSSRQTFAVLLVLCGIAPMALGLAGAVSGIVRPQNPAASALAILAPLTLAALVISTASYTVKGLDALIHERFAVYTVPLLVPLALQFLERPRAVRAALAIAFGATLLGVTAFAQAAGHHYSYAAPVDRVILGRVQQLGRAAGIENLSATWLLVPVAIAVIAAALLLIRRARPAVAVAVFAATMVPFLLASSAFDYNRALHPRAGDNIIGLRPDSDSGGGNWVDRVLPSATHAAFAPGLVADIGTTRKLWWDAEFWNKSITRMYALDPAWVDSGFPYEKATLRFDSGTFDVPHPLPYLVVSSDDRRFAPIGRTVARNGSLELVRVGRPIRARWATTGMAPDGWSTPGTTPVVRVYPSAPTSRQRLRVTIALTAPPDVTLARRVTVHGGERDVTVDVHRSRADVVTTFACVSPRRPRDLALLVSGSSPLAGRKVGTALLGVRVVPAGVCVAPRSRGQ